MLGVIIDSGIVLIVGFSEGQEVSVPPDSANVPAVSQVQPCVKGVPHDARMT